MAELARFRLTRLPRRAVPADEAILSPPPGDPPDESFLRALLDLVATVTDDLPYEAQNAARAYLDGDRSIVEPELREGVVPEGDGAAMLLCLVVLFDRWLARQGGVASPEDALDELQRLTNESGAPTALTGLLGAPESPEFSALAWRILEGLAVSLLVGPEEEERARRLSRLALVLGLIVELLAKRVQDADQVESLLSRSVLLPSPPFPDVLFAPRVRLVRAATVSDLFVLRSEWACYLAGEIAEIRNVMKGETFRDRMLTVDERETIETDETVEATTTEQEDITRSSSETSEEVQRELALAVKADAQVEVEGSYGPMKIAASAGVAVDLSLQESTNRATRLAREVSARSLGRVEQRVRDERVRRTLTRLETESSHGFKPQKAHVSGVYRWVDRADRFQLFRYPDRLMLEFELPEPGRYLEKLLSQPVTLGSIPPPPAFTLDLATIDRTNYSALGRDYRASGIPAPPSPMVAVSTTLAAAAAQGTPEPTGTIWNPPVFTDSDELAIPSGYAARRVTLSGYAEPFRANWQRENTTRGGSGPLEDFHVITVTAGVGDKHWADFQTGTTDPTWRNALQLGKRDAQNQPLQVQYLDAALQFSHSDAVLDPIVTKLPVSLSVMGGRSATAAVEIECEPTEAALAEWRQQVFDACLTAHDTWEREYRAEQARLGGPVALHERSPTRNRELVRNELKRQVIAWLLGEEDFAGRDAVGGHDVSGFDLQAALDQAPVIQFLEQAIEWSNLTYIPYPYYWGRKAGWDKLSILEAVDADLARFLSAGSVRVVVPARPGLENDMLSWILWQIPWSGGAPPIPGSDRYVSIATELADLTRPPEDGVPGKSWEARTPTTLRWLDRDPDLPKNTANQLTAPKTTLCD